MKEKKIAYEDHNKEPKPNQHLESIVQQAISTAKDEPKTPCFPISKTQSFQTKHIRFFTNTKVFRLCVYTQPIIDMLNALLQIKQKPPTTLMIPFLKERPHMCPYNQEL